jgi:hypothetical protein
MPDMPYYNQPNDPSQQFGQNIPNPSSQMMDYSYLQNNQAVMNLGQNNLAATMRTAQDNFHRDMANVLQGTMAASMAIYNTGKSVVDKAKETQYQDMLLGGGNYELQRGFIREAAWASGIAQSEFGRALKIGGRRPEFMSQEELEFQMQRSWNHRIEDLKIEAGGGLTSVLSSALGSGAAKLLSPMAGLGVGFALDQIVGRLYNVGYAQPEEYKQNFRKMTEITDLSYGAGQRRLDKDTSDALIGRFYESERNPYGARYIPLIGDALADRLAPDTKASEFIPKMMQAGLFRDQNLKDVDGMEKFVKDTIVIVEKFAALANTTKDSILGLKAKLNQMGFNNLEQNTMMGNMITTSMSTGLDLATVANLGGAYIGMGLQSGLNKGIVGQSGLTELASVKALQEAGIIDRSIDAGSLSIKNTERAIGYGQYGYGFINRFSGNASSPQSAIATAAAYLASRAGGSTAAGTVLMQHGMLPDATDPNANLKKAAISMYQEFSKNKTPSEAYAAVVGVLNPQTPEERAQVDAALFDGGMGSMLAAGSAARKEADRTNNPTKLTTFSLNSIRQEISPYSNSNSIKLESFYKDIKSSNVTDEERDSFGAFRSLFSDRIGKLYSSLLKGDVVSATKIKRSIMEDATMGSGAGNNLSSSNAEKAINMILAEIEKEREARKDDSVLTTMLIDDFAPWLKSKRVLLREGGSSRMTIGQAVRDASTYGQDPRNFGKLEGYSPVSDKVYKAFEKIVNGKNIDSLRLLYSNMGDNKDENVAAFDEIINMPGNNLSKDEINLLEKYIRADGSIGAGGKGLFAEYQKRRNQEDEFSERNAFVAIQNAGHGKYSNINFDTYKDKVGKLKYTIDNFKNMSAADVKKWLSQGTNKKDLIYNAEIATGSSNFAEALVRNIEMHADLNKNDKENHFSEFMHTGWFKDMQIGPVDDAANKQFGVSADNPNNQAVEALTRACNALANAIK